MALFGSARRENGWGSVIFLFPCAQGRMGRILHVHNRLLSFEQCRGSLPFAACHHRLKLQLITFSPLNLHLTPLNHKNQRLKLKSEQPVMSDNLLTATAARRLSNTYLGKFYLVAKVFYVHSYFGHKRSFHLF